MMEDKWYYSQEPLPRIKNPKRLDVTSEYSDTLQIDQYKINITLQSVRRDKNEEIVGFLYFNDIAVIIDTAPSYKSFVLAKKKIDSYLDPIFDKIPADTKLYVFPPDAKILGFESQKSEASLSDLINPRAIKQVFDIITEQQNTPEQEQSKPKEDLPMDDIEKKFLELRRREEEELRKSNIVPTKNFRTVRNAIHSFYESILAKIQYDDVQSNDLGLVIFGPPGVGKTFAVRRAQHELEHDCAWINLSGDSIDINSLSDALYGYSILSADGSATKSDFVFGGFVQALSEAVKQGKNTMGVVVNEFNRSAAMGKLDQIIRDIGDNQSIMIETAGNLDELQRRLYEQYGVYAKIERNGLRIDLNNVDGNGRRIGTFFLLIGNPPDAYISAAQYGVVPLTAALSRRLRSVSVDYINPHKEHDDLVDMFKNSASYKLLTRKYHNYVNDPTDEFDNKLLDTLETLYESFYNMWTQHKIMIVPAPTEISEQVENALMLYRDVLREEELQEGYKDSFNAYFQKLDNVGLFRMGREDTVTDIADTFATGLVRLGKMFNRAYIKHYVEEMERG